MYLLMSSALEHIRKCCSSAGNPLLRLKCASRAARSTAIIFATVVFLGILSSQALADNNAKVDIPAGANGRSQVLATATLASQASPALMSLPGQFAVGDYGDANYNIPIQVAPGTAGMVPALSLAYSSTSGDGIVGWQWSLTGLPSITHCARTVAQDTVHGGVNYDSNDRFCLGGQRLILTSGTYGANLSQYRTEIESFKKIVAHGTAGNGPQWFEIHLPSGTILQLGNTTDSRILAVGKTTVATWTVNKITDTKGNYLTVTYTNDTTNGQYYPTRIDYTGNASASLATYNSVRFTYNTARPDITPQYQAGSLLKRKVLLTDIKSYQGANVVFDYKLTYRLGSATTRSRLTSVQLCDGASTCLAPTTFGWQGGAGTVSFTGTTTTLEELGFPPSYTFLGDFNADGLPDLIVLAAACDGTQNTFYFGTAAGSFVASGNMGGLCTDPLHTYYPSDINGDGLSDLIASYSVFGSNFTDVYSNTGTALSHLSPSYSSLALVGDFSGDNRTDFYEVASTGTAGPLHLSLGNGSFGSQSASIAAVEFAADFDGDGCDDVASAHSTGGTVDGVIINYSCSPATTPVTTIGPTSNIIGDFNGDGKADILGYLSTGTGFVALGSGPPANVVGAGDFDGDGRTDLLVHNTAASTFDIYLSNGNGFTLATSVSCTGTNQTAYAPSDWSGDGAADFWTVCGNNGSTVIKYYTANYTPERINSISNGLGASVTVTYDRLNHATIYTKGTGATYPTSDLVNAAFVVSRVDRSNGIGGNYSYTYAYSGAKQDAGGRGFLGFSQITITDLQSNVVQTTNYRTDYPYVGVISSQTSTRSGTTLSSVTNTFSSTSLGGTRYFVFLQQSVSSGTDLDGTSTWPTITANFTFDTYGNPLTETVSRSDGSSSTTTNTFTNDSTNWILGQLMTRSVQNIVGSSNLTRHYSFGHDSATGLLNQVVLEPSNPTYKLQIDYTLDAFGHATTTALSGSGITSRSSNIGYDALGEFATSTTNALSQGDSTGYSAAFGIATSHTDIDGLVASLTLDTLGRPTLQTFADGTKLSISYLYCSGVNGGTASCPTNGAFLVQSERLASNGTTQIGPIKTTYLDSLGRRIASDSQGFDGSNLRVATQYDANGRVSQTSRPYFTTGGTAKWTVYTYDALNRVTKAVFPDTSQTTYAFHGLTTSFTNNLSQTTSKTLNAEGLPASVTDAASHVTQYVYDAFNNLLSVTDPSGNVVSNTFDIRGRKTASTDPDMGSWIYNYDVLSELTSQTDAKSQITNLTYDLLGRVTERTEADMVSDWVYDGATHGIGRLQATCTSAASNPTCTSALTTKTFTYDVTGRPSTTTINTDSTNFVYSTTYNATNGAIDTVTYPSGLVTKNVYNSYGDLCSITDTVGSPTCTSGGGSNVFFTVNTADAELHLLQQTAGNGVVTTGTFDSNTGLLTNIRSGPSNSVAQFDYSYDTIGNLTYRSDDYLGVFERYCYDNLNRLTNSATGASGVTTCTSSGTGITTKTVGYDQLGNITTKSDVGTYSYPVSGSGSIRPHAVSSITGTVNGVTNPSYTYDSNGNMTVGAGLTATYMSFNLTSSLTEGSNKNAFNYDSDHARIKMCYGPIATCGTSTTYYLNDPATGAMSEQFVSGGTTTWRDFLKVGGRTIAERFSVVGGSTNWNYFILDHLGSVAVNTDGTGTVTERLSYDAWGRRRNADGTDNAACSITSATTRGFTGHEEMDSVCEVNANARIYDPTLGRFMSADTIVPDALNGQDLNRYTYVENGPLSATDPTGHIGISDQCTCFNVTKPQLGLGIQGSLAGGGAFEVFGLQTYLAGPSGFGTPGLMGGGGSFQNISDAVFGYMITTPHFSLTAPSSDTAQNSSFANGSNQPNKSPVETSDGYWVYASSTVRELTSTGEWSSPATSGHWDWVANDANGGCVGCIQVAANGIGIPQVTLNRLQGLRAEGQAESELIGQGYTVVRYVSFRDPATGKTAVIDMVAHQDFDSPNSPTGKTTVYVFEEVKSGNGQLTVNQAAVATALANGTAIPIGPNARAAGLIPGEPTGPQVGPVFLVVQGYQGH